MDEMSGNYPELKRASSLIKETLRMEEEKFLVLLDRGIKILDEEIKKVDINQASALKVFMGASFGEMLVDDIDALDDIFNYSPLIVVTHCEDQKTVKKNEDIYSNKYGEDLCAEHHHLIRDVDSCYLSSSLAVDLAKKYDSDLHVFHLTTEKEMELFTPGKVCLLYTSPSPRD